jgi:NodT family efflux transporter outer membrane factor (OMF) lipoprotein
MKYHKLVLSSVMMSLIMAGCAVPGDIHTHNSLLSSSALSSSKTLGSSSVSQANWPTQQWWTQMGDPALTQLINEALKNSPSMQVAQARLDQARASVDAADALLYPTLTGSASITRAKESRYEDPLLQGDTFGTLRSLGTTFSYDFDLWGGKRAAWEASVSAEKAAEVDHQAARIALSTSIASTYSTLANAYVLADLADRNYARTQQIESITANLLKSGLTSQDKLLTAQSAVSSAKQQIQQRALAIKQIKNGLSTLLGEGPDRALTIARPKLALNRNLGLPANLPAELLSHRPDITAAKWRVEAAAKNIDVAKARFYPDFNLTAMAGFKSVLGDAVFEDISQSASITPAISLPIFMPGLKANLKEQTASYDAAVATYNQTLVNALGDVSDNVLVLQSIQQQIDQANQSVDFASRAYDISEKRYNAGLGSQLDVLSTEQQLLQAELEEANLRQTQQDHIIALVKSLGGGFQPTAQTTSK